MKRVLLAGIGVLVLKFIAYFITHSNAILSDALESIINVVAGAFAYYSLRLAAKPKDLDHPYGHGKIEFISAGFEGGLILIAGLIIIFKGVFNLIHPITIYELDKGAMLSGFAGLVNFFMGRYLINTGNKYRSITLVADGKHLLSDTWSSLGLIAGIIIIHFTQLFWIDHLIAIAFGVLIIFTGLKLVRKSLAGLMDESDTDIINDVLIVLNKNRELNWIDIHNLRLLQYGSSFHLDCHITLPWYNNLQATHDELQKIEALITEQFHHKVELFIHPDPCLPQSCLLCQLKHCPERKHEFVQKVDWTLENILKNEKHQLNT